MWSILEHAHTVEVDIEHFDYRKNNFNGSSYNLQLSGYQKKEIYTYSVFIFYTAIAVIMIYKGFSGISIDYISMLLGILSGFILLPLSKINILGEGDAFVFIGCGAILGIKENLLLFFISIFILSIYALFLSMYCMIKRKKIKGIRVAMLPFITLANCILWFCV